MYRGDPGSNPQNRKNRGKKLQAAKMTPTQTALLDLKSGFPTPFWVGNHVVQSEFTLPHSLSRSQLPFPMNAVKQVMCTVYARSGRTNGRASVKSEYTT